MLDARYSNLYFCQNLNRLQRGLSAIAELLVTAGKGKNYKTHSSNFCISNFISTLSFWLLDSETQKEKILEFQSTGHKEIH